MKLAIHTILAVMLLVSCGTGKQTLEGESYDFKGAIYVDRFDEIYTIDKDHTVVKYDKDLKPIFKYANNLQGEITQLDVNNPQNVLAYIPNFGRIIVLDNTLAELSIISLTDLGYLDVETVAKANDGNYWLYDDVNYRLVKIANDGSKLAESNRLSDYNLGEFQASYLIERDNKVYLSTNNGQLLIFDNFGQYLKAIPMDVDGKFSVRKSLISYRNKAGQLMHFDMKMLANLPAVADPSFKELSDYAITKSGDMHILDSDGKISILKIDSNK